MILRSSMGEARYTAAAEFDVVFGTRRTWGGWQPDGVIYCHGGGNDCEDVFASVNQRNLLRAAAADATVHCGDLAFDSWGNDTAITRVGEAIAYLRSGWSQVGPVALVGLSMGALSALNYTLANPDEVACVALIIPGLDLEDLLLRGVAAGINAAYGGAYNDVTDGPTHSPVQFAADLPASLPIRMWTSSNDIFAVPATADDFMASRPQTVRTDLGAVGHSSTVIPAAQADIVEWVQQNL
jgi:pimeloyl-ACP methyl ester carboxylesterase